METNIALTAFVDEMAAILGPIIIAAISIWLSSLVARVLKAVGLKADEDRIEVLRGRFNDVMDNALLVARAELLKPGSLDHAANSRAVAQMVNYALATAPDTVRALTGGDVEALRAAALARAERSQPMRGGL